MSESTHILKRFDTFLFQKLDELKQQPGYSKSVEFYANLEEDQQRIAKWVLLSMTALLPLIVVMIFWLQNSSLHSDLENRIELVDTMQEIITQNSEAGGLSMELAASSPISSESEMQSRLSMALSRSSIDLSKIRISNFNMENVSDTLIRAESDVKFEGLSTEQLMSLFTFMIQTEKFKISSVEITRSTQSNMLEGFFHGIHFGQVLPKEDDY
jgi:hypothetical protein